MNKTLFAVVVFLLTVLSCHAATSSKDAEIKNYDYGDQILENDSSIMAFIRSLDFDKYPPKKRLVDFYNDEQKLPDDKNLLKAISLFEKGKIDKAIKLFQKIKKDKKTPYKVEDYASWQIYHYNAFGCLDVHFNGIASKMNRKDLSGESPNAMNYYGETKNRLLMFSDPYLATHNPKCVIDVLTSSNWTRIRQKTKFSKEFVAAVLYEAFPKDWVTNGWGISKYTNYKPVLYTYVSERTSTTSGAIDLQKNIEDWLNFFDCLHIVGRVGKTVREYYGIGLSAEELYKKAKELSPTPKYDLVAFSGEYRNRNQDIEDKCKLYLLRSASYGYIDALFELWPYIASEYQHHYYYYAKYSKTWKKDLDKEGLRAMHELNKRISYNISYLLGFDENSAESKLNQYGGIAHIRKFKEYMPFLKIIQNQTVADHEILKEICRNDRYEEEAIKREKKLRRQQFWANVGTAVLGAVAQTAAAMQSGYYPTPAVNAMPMAYGAGAPGSLAAAMEQPGYFQQQYNQLMQLSYNQVQWAEMQEYNYMREQYNRIGKDLSYQEYVWLKGQAIQEMKDEGYDYIAEQKAIAKEMHDYNRSTMNSGKESLARIHEQNQRKYGTSGSATPASSTSATKTSSNNNATPSSASSTTKPQNSSTITNRVTPTSDTNAQKSSNSNNDAHQQYKNGNQNTDSKTYGDKIKNVQLSVKDGASYRSTSTTGELYKKDGQHYLKIGSTFFKVEHTGGTYNSYIIYGAKAMYFNR